MSLTVSRWGTWAGLKLARRLTNATRLVYSLIRPVVFKKEPDPGKEEISPSSRKLSPFTILDYLDRFYLPFYYGLSIVTASSFYYAGYKLLGPTLNQAALACLKLVAGHPYLLILLSDLPILLLTNGIILVFQKMV